MKSVTAEFKSGGLHEKHVVATWNVGNRLSMFHSCTVPQLHSSTVEQFHSCTKVNEAVDFKMAANEPVREGGVVICDCLVTECQHILEKRNKREKRRSARSAVGNRS